MKDETSFIGKTDRDDALVAGYPGAAIIITPTGDILAANAKAAGLESLISRSAVPEIGKLVATAHDIGSIATDTVSLSGAQGKISLDLTAISVESDRLLLLARDMTMDKNLRSALTESRQRYKDLVEVSSDFSWETSADDVFVFVSTKGAIGYVPSELTGRPVSEFIVDPENYTTLPFCSKRPLGEVEIWMKTKEGESACMMLSCVPLFAKQEGRDVWNGTRGVCRDVTGERQSQAALPRPGAANRC